MISIRRAARLLIGGIILLGLLALLRWTEHLLGGGGFYSGVLTGLLLPIAAYWVVVSRVKQVMVDARKKSTAAHPAPTLVEHDTAVYGWQVNRLDGTALDMNDVRSEVVFLNVWSTMCLPCIEELASIERLHEILAPEGVVFMCIATDDDLAELRMWTDEHKVLVPVFALASRDLPSVFASECVPATYLVASDGRIALQHEGAAQWDHPRVVSFLRSLLAESSIMVAQEKSER